MPELYTESPEESEVLLKSPCVGFCSTTFGDPVCRGCKRLLAEVDGWNLLTTEQQQQIWQRLWQQTVVIVRQHIRISDPLLLQNQLQRFAIRHHPAAPAEVLAMDLLRAGSEKMQQLQAYGIEPLTEFNDLSPARLFNRMNRMLYEAAISDQS